MREGIRMTVWKEVGTTKSGGVRTAVTEWLGIEGERQPVEKRQ